MINKTLEQFKNQAYNKLSDLLIKVLESSIKDDFRNQEKLLAFN